MSTRTLHLNQVVTSTFDGMVRIVECGSVTLLSLVLSIRVMLELLVETTA
jgi:hypothetical protein